jgi:hypothetical protein
LPQYSGKFQYGDQSGPCQVSFDAETCVVTPASGTPVAFDLGDVDGAAPGEWDMTLSLFTGRTLKLQQFGAAFGRMRDELVAAWRDRTVRCLLLEDLQEVARYDAAVNGTAAQVRLYESNLAALPMSGDPVQCRLADMDSIFFDTYSYTVKIEAGAGKLAIGKLAKKTEEFREKLGAAVESIRRHTAEALHQTFPFLDPDRLQRLVTTMPEGRSTPRDALAAIHPKLPDALVAGAVDDDLRPYFDALRSRSAGSWHAGFKFIRPDEEREAAGEGQTLFFWFFFPMAGKDLVAWEATTGTGRATYFFRSNVAVEQLTRGLALVNFRREPVYLADDSLEQQPRYHRYAIGARKLPDLRQLRAAYAGRAIHSTVDEWTAQLDNQLR